MKFYLYGLAFVASYTYAQEQPVKRFRTYEKQIQISLLPGISTNGIASGFYYNKFSFNFFGGLSAGTHILEIGFLTNSHFQSSTGIQLAGLANIGGTNTFYNLTLWEERSLIHDNYEVNNKGVMISGLLNYTLNNASGIQISGGFNHAGNNFKGFQLAGLGNSAGANSTGVHIAGVYNLVHKSISGIQISAVFNYTGEQLSGTQIALINKARWMKGKNSTPFTTTRSLQIGIINFSKAMHGTQIGLINFGGEMRGKQIGLINFFNRLKSKENSNAGTPIGLLNLGSFGSVFRLSYTDIFPATIEYTTGTCQNCTWTPAGPVGMPYDEPYKIRNQNALILGFNPFQDTWGFGYGFMKLLTNKATSAPSARNEKHQFSYGIRFLHLNKYPAIDQNFNLVTRVSFDYGKRIKSKYVFAGAAINFFVQETNVDLASNYVQGFSIDTGSIENLITNLWPGYMVGIQL